MPDHLRPASALGVQGFQHDHNHNTQTAEYSSRLAATDMRVATQDWRINASQDRIHGMNTSINNCTSRLGKLETNYASLDAKYTNLEAGCTALDVKFGGQVKVIEHHQKKIDEQNRQLRFVTAKLEEFQAAINDLRATIKEHKTQSQALLVRSPNTRDVLDNLEVMVRAMRDAHTKDDEIQGLRHENSAMKTRLNTIATAMGAASRDHSSLPIDENGLEDAEETSILGKRKRALSCHDDQAREVAQQPGSGTKKFKQNEPLLPTPDSSLNGAQYLQDSAEHESQVDNDDESTEDREGPELTDQPDSVVAVDDSRMVGNSACQPDALNTEDNYMECMDGGSPHLRDLSASNHAQSYLPVDEPDRSEIDHIQPQRLVDGQDVHGEDHPIFESSRSTTVMDGLVQAPQSTSAIPVPVPALQNGFVAMQSSITSPSVRNVTASAPFWGSLLLPPSQPNYQDYANTPTPSKLAASTDPNSHETFSGALSRGERLDNLIRRTHSPSATDIHLTRRQNVAPTQHTGNNTSDGHASILRPRQGSTLGSGRIPEPTLTAIGEAQPKTNGKLSNVPSNAESIDFSDEENEEPANLSIQNNNRTFQSLSTTPATEPRRRATLVSRTIRGFTLEPLIRPVIEDNRANSVPAHKESNRKQLNADAPNWNARGPSIMPEFMAAINILNESAARQATPAPTTRSHKPAGVPKKSRKSEPIRRSSAAIPSTASTVSPATTSTPAVKVTVNINNGSTPSADDHQHPRSTPSHPHNQFKISAAQSAAKARTGEAGSPANDDECAGCQKAGTLIMCNGCPKSYHRKCLTSPPRKNEPEDVPWFCPECSERRRVRQGEQQHKDATRKSLLREQVLIERNMLAMEAMEREEAADRQSS